MLKIHFTPLNYREINQPETIAVLAEINHYKGKTDWEYFCLFIDVELDPGEKKNQSSQETVCGELCTLLAGDEDGDEL